MKLVILMKVLFKNTTQYTESVYETFLMFHHEKYKFSYLTYTIIVVGLLLFSLILQVSYHNFSLAILFCCGITLFILWRLFHPISEIAKEYESDKIQEEKEFTFTFYDQFFTVEDKKEIAQFKYHYLHKIFETKDFFYLYIDKTHSFLLDKYKFQFGSNFSAFIQKKCWWNFRLF